MTTVALALAFGVYLVLAGVFVRWRAGDGYPWWDAALWGLLWPLILASCLIAWAIESAWRVARAALGGPPEAGG